MSYGDWPAITDEHYSPEERFEQDTGELIDRYEEADHPGWKAEFAYSLVELAYEEGLRTGWRASSTPGSHDRCYGPVSPVMMSQ